MEDGSVPGIVVDLDRPRWRHQRPRKCQHLSTAAASGGLASRGTDRGIKRKTGRDQTVHAFLLLCDKTSPRVLRAGKSPPHPPNAQSRVRATRTAPAASAPCPWGAAPRPAGDSRPHLPTWGVQTPPPPPHTPPHPVFNGMEQRHPISLSLPRDPPHTPTACNAGASISGLRASGAVLGGRPPLRECAGHWECAGRPPPHANTQTGVCRR